MDIKKFKETGIIDLNQEDTQDPGTMQMVFHLLNKQQDEWAERIEEIQDEFSLDHHYAMAVWYLRTRSRWTQELESRLIRMYRDGEPCPNTCDWPPEENED